MERPIEVSPEWKKWARKYPKLAQVHSGKMLPSRAEWLRSQEICDKLFRKVGK